MLRGIVTVLLLVLLVVGCWMLYGRITGGNGIHNGDVYSLNSGEKDQMESGTTFVGDKPVEEAHPTPSRSDDPGTINTEPVPNAQYNNNVADTRVPGTSGETQQYALTPSQDSQHPQAAQNQQTAPAQPYSPYSQQPYKGVSPARPVASSDTFNPNPPNGFAFAGTGAYEVYRQGDLTFRIDTKSGASCVLYATMEEWAKPIVYLHGCGSRGWRRRWQLDKANNTPLSY